VTDDAGLFDVPELRLDAGRRGRVEAGLMRALEAADAAGKLIPEDGGMIGAALVAARALDHAEQFASAKTAYAIQAAMPSYMEALHALRLPVKVAPVPAAASAQVSQTDPSDWLGDAFGTPGD
jgi:hypothetical protein